MYEVSAREVDAYHDSCSSEVNEDIGLIISVRPPIDFVPNAVRNYLTNQFLYDQDEYYEEGNREICGVQLLGSTDEATSIYIGTTKEYVEEVKPELVESTIKLIELLGSTATKSE
jgi:hypothetical protein